MAMDSATPKDNNNAHSVSLNIPIVATMPLEDSANIQNASKKTAGVRISAVLMWGRYVFMVFVSCCIFDRYPVAN